MKIIPMMQQVYPNLLKYSTENIGPLRINIDQLLPLRCQIDFQAENGYWQQAVRAERAGDRVVFAFRVLSFEAGKDGMMESNILHEDLDKEFPNKPTTLEEKQMFWAIGEPIDLSELTVSTESAEDSIRKSLGMR